MFYPSDPAELRAQVRGFLDAAAGDGPRPLALIAPHAGYVYSGRVAGSAYARLTPVAHEIERVVLLGPCHRVPVQGLAASSAGAFSTPLGDVPVDRGGVESILDLPQVAIFDETHDQEHSLEVHLPFLKVDHATSRSIEALEVDGLGPRTACGRIPIRGLLTEAKRRGLSVTTVDLCNSGDTAGPSDQVVGYGAYVVHA
jgi:predicted class III extradiol MEMO1 family dioxygenase